MNEKAKKATLGTLKVLFLIDATSVVTKTFVKQGQQVVSGAKAIGDLWSKVQKRPVAARQAEFAEWKERNRYTDKDLEIIRSQQSKEFYIYFVVLAYVWFRFMWALGVLDFSMSLLLGMLLLISVLLCFKRALRIFQLDKRRFCTVREFLCAKWEWWPGSANIEEIPSESNKIVAFRKKEDANE